MAKIQSNDRFGFNYAQETKSNIIVNPNWKQYKEIPKRIAALQIKDEVIDTISLRSL